MKKLKYLLFLCIIFLTPSVFADDFNVTSTITAPTCSGSNCSGGHYTSLEIYNSGSQNVYATNTRYNGQISTIRFNVPLPSNWPDGDYFSTGDLTYTLTLNMATNDWRNYFARPFISDSSSGTNFATSNIVFVNRQKIYFNFKIPNNISTDFLYVYLQSTNQSSTAFTGVSNWNLSNVVLTANFPTSSGGGSSGGGSSGATNQDIINNQTNNTNSIINNQTDNTNNIIDNANQNTQDIINSNKENFNTCYFNHFNLSNFSSFSDNISSSSNKGNYILIRSNTSTYDNVSIGKTLNQMTSDLQIGKDYTLSFTGENIKNYIYLSGSNIIWYSNTSHTITSSDLSSIISFYTSSRPGDGNVRNIMIQETGNESSSYIPYGEKCINKIDNQTNAINGVNDSINDSNVDSDTGTGFFDNFTSQDFGLSQIITIPLNTIQSLTSKSCVPLQVPIPFTNSNINLPCMTEIYETKFPSIYNLWKIVSFGIVAYLIAIDIFHIVKGFKDPESDKVEVLDL